MGLTKKRENKSLFFFLKNDPLSVNDGIILVIIFFVMGDIFTITNILLVILLITLYRGFVAISNCLEKQHQETLEKIDSVKGYLHYLYGVIKGEEDNDEEDNDEDIDKK